MVVAGILIPVVSLTVTALALGGCIVLVSKKFYVYEDPLIETITKLLPNANCGACGYPGCSQFAAALVETRNPQLACPVGGEAIAESIGPILGMKLAEAQPVVCAIRCQGTTKHAKETAEYHGIMDCWAAMQAFHGTKLCAYACTGLGSCLSACNYGALRIEDGLLHIDGDRCVGCGLCIQECPVKVLEMVPRSAWRYYIACSSKDKGAATRKYCDVGCIACKRCEKDCPAEAITVTDNVAVIDQNLCVACGVCIDVCPTKSIVLIHDSTKKRISS